MCIKETPASKDSGKDRCATKSLHFCVAEPKIPMKFVLHRLHTHLAYASLSSPKHICFLGLGAQDIPIKARRGKESNRSSGAKILFLFLTLCTFIFLCFTCVIQCNTNFSLLPRVHVHHLVAKRLSVLEKATKTYTILKENNQMSCLHHSG